MKETSEILETLEEAALPVVYETLYYGYLDGNYAGGYAGPPSGNPYPNSVEVPFPPQDARAKWNGKDWDEPAPPPNIPGFFDGLGKLIVTGQIPGTVYGEALLVKDQLKLEDQQALLLQLSANPAYTKEQKQLLDGLVKQYNLLLPEIGK